MTESKRDLAQDLDSNNPNYLDRFNAMAGCLAGSTQISLLDGTYPTIQEMEESKKRYIGKYVYSVSPSTKEIEPEKIVDVKKTKSDSEVCRVYLDNERYVDCTLDHRFMLRDGTYKEAQYLKPGDSLMPLYTRICHAKRYLGYREIYIPSTEKYRVVHRVVQECLRGIKKEMATHHKDLNKLNNDPSNLAYMNKQGHWILHSKLGGQFTRKHKGHTYAQMYGNDKAIEIRKKQQEHSASKKRAGKTYEEIVGQDKAARWRNSVSEGHKGIKYPNRKSIKQTKAHMDNVRKALAEVVEHTCEYCGKCWFGPRNGLGGHTSQCHKNPKNAPKYETRRCKCSDDCNETFECRRDSTKIFFNHRHYWKYKVGKRRQSAKSNHKVISMERLTERKEMYAITTEKNHNFAVTVGVFVHDSKNAMS
jgi:hypothetical protein